MCLCTSCSGPDTPHGSHLACRSVPDPDAIVHGPCQRVLDVEARPQCLKGHEGCCSLA